MGDLIRREGEQKRITVLWILVGYLIILFSGIVIHLSLRKDTKNNVPNRAITNSTVGKITDKLVYLQRPGGFLKPTYDLESGIAISPHLMITATETLYAFKSPRIINDVYRSSTKKDQSVDVSPIVINEEIALLSTNGKNKFNDFVDLDSATLPQHQQRGWLVFIDQGYIFKAYQGFVSKQVPLWMFHATMGIDRLEKVISSTNGDYKKATSLGGAIIDQNGNFIGMVIGPHILKDHYREVFFITAAEIKSLLISLNLMKRNAQSPALERLIITF